MKLYSCVSTIFTSLCLSFITTIYFRFNCVSVINYCVYYTNYSSSLPSKLVVNAIQLLFFNTHKSFNFRT